MEGSRQFFDSLDSDDGAEFELVRDLSSQVESVPHNDPRLAALHQALKQNIQRALATNEPSQLHTILKEAIAERRMYGFPVGSTYMEHLLVRCIQHELLFYGEHYEVGRKYQYPDDYPDSAVWTEAIDEITAMAGTKYSNFAENLIVQNLQSNVSDRYKAFKLIAFFFQQRLGQRPNILDVGASLNLGLTKMAIGHSFEPVEIVLPNSADELVYNPEWTDMTNQLITSRLNMGQSLGIDAVDWRRSEAARRWIKSCSFYPSELLDQKKVREHEHLARANPTNVAFETFDILDEESEHTPELERAGKFLLDVYPSVEKYDMIIFSTVLNQMREDQRVAAIANASKYLQPHGLLVVQDFMEIDPNSPSKLRFYDHWYDKPYPYRTVVFDPMSTTGDLNTLEIFRWENGRCRRAMLNLASMSLISGGLSRPGV